MEGNALATVQDHLSIQALDTSWQMMDQSDATERCELKRGHIHIPVRPRPQPAFPGSGILCHTEPGRERGRVPSDPGRRQDWLLRKRAGAGSWKGL